MCNTREATRTAGMATYVITNDFTKVGDTEFFHELRFSDGHEADEYELEAAKRISRDLRPEVGGKGDINTLTYRPLTYHLDEAELATLALKLQHQEDKEIIEDYYPAETARLERKVMFWRAAAAILAVALATVCFWKFIAH